ncbi:MAG TPA: ABC transporter substrate-binding protein [candidate division Zixibacteria bacterium]|nr:ABC transporter substrate-binding protein [candidate division Zixibacteria bacterium]
MTRRFRSFAPIAVALSLVLVLAACQQGENGGGGEGGTVSLLVVFGGEELTNFESMLAPFEEETGIDVQIESNRDANAILQTRIDGGNPPDVAGLPGPGPMAQFARDGHLKQLPQEVIDILDSNYDEGWKVAGSVDGTPYGIFVKTSLKGLIWYNPQAFSDAGYEPPEDWDGLVSLVDEIADSGTPPWGIGLESGAASGWPGTDWIEDFVLRQSGPEVYDAWVNGEQAWTSPEIRAAFEAFGQWATDPIYVAGGPNAVLSTAFGNGGDCLFAEPPGCYLHHQASFMSGFFEENFPEVAAAGETYDYFMMPPIEFNAITTAGDLFGMFNDTDAAKQLMAYLVSAEAQEAWVRTGGVLSANKEVPTDAYPDDATRRAAEIMTSAETTRFDASDQMPSAMNDAFFGAILDYVQNPDNLDSILEELDGVQAEAYGE